MGISNVDSTYKPRKTILQTLDHFPCWDDLKVESTKTKIEINAIFFLNLPVCLGQTRTSEM